MPVFCDFLLTLSVFQCSVHSNVCRPDIWPSKHMASQSWSPHFHHYGQRLQALRSKRNRKRERYTDTNTQRDLIHLVYLIIEGRLTHRHQIINVRHGRWVCCHGNIIVVIIISNIAGRRLQQLEQSYSTTSSRPFLTNNSSSSSNDACETQYTKHVHALMDKIPVLGSQPAGDMSYKPGGRLPLLYARPAFYPHNP